MWERADPATEWSARATRPATPARVNCTEEASKKRCPDTVAMWWDVCATVAAASARSTVCPARCACSAAAMRGAGHCVHASRVSAVLGCSAWPLLSAPASADIAADSCEEAPGQACARAVCINAETSGAAWVLVNTPHAAADSCVAVAWLACVKPVASTASPPDNSAKFVMSRSAQDRELNWAAAACATAAPCTRVLRKTESASPLAARWARACRSMGKSPSTNCTSESEPQWPRALAATLDSVDTKTACLCGRAAVATDARKPAEARKPEQAALVHCKSPSDTAPSSSLCALAQRRASPARAAAEATCPAGMWR